MATKRFDKHSYIWYTIHNGNTTNKELRMTDIQKVLEELFAIPEYADVNENKEKT